MEEQTSNLSRQAILLLLLFSCLAVGLKTILVKFLPFDLVPQVWDLTIAGAFALTLAGLSLCSVVLCAKQIIRLSLSAVLLGYSITSVYYSGWIDEGSATDPTRGVWSPLLPALFLSLLGICCGLGLTPRSLLLWRVSASLGILFGALALLGDFGVASFPGVLEMPAKQASFTGAIFTIVLGLIFWIVTVRPDRPVLSIPSTAIGIGIAGVLATLVLMYVATIERHEERQKAAHDLLQNFALSIEQASQNRVQMLQRMVERWSLLPDDAGAGFYKREARLLTEDKPSFIGYVLIGPPNSENWRHASVPGNLLWIKEQLVRPHSLRWLREFRSSRATASWLFPSDENPSRALIVVRPSDNRRLTLIGAIDLNTFIQREIRKDPGEFVIGISQNDTSINPLVGAESTISKTETVYANYQAQLPANGQVLKLSARSGFQIFGDQFHHYLPAGILIFGLILTHQLMLSRSLGHVRDQQARRLALSEQRFRSLYDHNPDAVFSLDRDGRYREINPVTEQHLGIAASKLVGTHFTDRINNENVPKKDLGNVYRAYNDARRGYPKTDFSMSFRNAEGITRNFEVTFLPIVIGGQIDGVFGLAKDVTKRIEMEEQQRIMQRSLEASSNAVVITDARGSGYPVVYVNPAFSQITGYSSDEVKNQSLGFLTGEDTADDDVELIKAAVREERSASVTIRSYRKDGTPFWNQLFISPVRDDYDEISHFIAVMNDISEKKEQDQELAYQATHDVLTGLANRSLFDDRLNHDFELAKRRSQLMAVLFIDLDEFKPINDTLGHKVGDKLLISVTERLNKTIRPSDTLARFGGDEFVLLLPDLTAPGEAEEIAERILDQLAKPHQIDTNELYISASIGIATNSADQVHPEKLLQQADMAMYKAKQQGRDTYETYSADLDRKLSKRVTLRNDLQEAIKNEQLKLHYQPLVGRNGRIVSIEALVRWPHPRKGNISPADFIPIAEETGQITPLGKWVTKQACQDALTLIKRDLFTGCMAVNLSPMQFHRPNFLATLRQILDETGLPPEHLELELTEGILMKDTEGAIDILNALSGMGVKTAIDDFGTGFSSFGYLRELPVNKIKIDRSFVKDVTSSTKDAAVCKGVITLARELGMRVVAEGVETAEQYRYLAENGCAGFQGYYFAKPMPLDELVTWIKQNADAGA